MNRKHIAPAVCIAGIAVGISNQQPAAFTGATFLWLTSFIILILLFGRPAMTSTVDLRPGTPVILNRSIGPKTDTHEAVFLGSTGNGFTVAVSGSIHPATTFRWDDPSAWIENPRTGRPYAPVTEEPVLASVTPELE